MKLWNKIEKKTVKKLIFDALFKMRTFFSYLALDWFFNFRIAKTILIEDFRCFSQ